MIDETPLLVQFCRGQSLLKAPSKIEHGRYNEASAVIGVSPFLLYLSRSDALSKIKCLFVLKRDGDVPLLVDKAVFAVLLDASDSLVKVTWEICIDSGNN